ncbi:hypothetical protein [Treponema sp. R6D11]
MKTIQAVTLKTKGIITIEGDSSYRLERKGANDDNWLAYTAKGFTMPDAENPALSVSPCDIVDSHETLNGIYSYRIVEFANNTPKPTDYEYSNIVRYGICGPIGWSFGNYQPPPGQWGEVCTPDDLRETWIWGTEFKATNGSLFSDNQIKYYTDNAIAEIERRLNITIKKKRIRCNPEKKGLEKGKDYDIEEALYDFKFARIQRYGAIPLRHHPIIKVHRFDLISRFQNAERSLLGSTIVDKTKGMLKLMERPLRPSETIRGIQTATNMYGTETLGMHLFYEIDYDAGYESAGDVPLDLREAISKSAAIALLNVVGDGLMSGFSSSSLSMDGLSESFSSTQSATSAYFGARVKVYQDELEKYIADNQRKFGHIPLGCL